ncbi:MAG: MG2 domain-containing protein [Armatimonadota bacterium]
MILGRKVTVSHVLSATGFAAVAVILVVGFAGMAARGQDRPGAGEIPRLGVEVIGQTELLTDSRASLRVIATDHGAKAPLRRAGVGIYLASDRGTERLLSDRTDRYGTLDAQFDIPDLEPGSYKLRVAVESPVGDKEVERDVTLKRVNQILLTTDKPIYQPNQVMHVRALALRKPKLHAVADEDLTLEVMDAKGNKVFKKVLKTDEFGIAATDFQLADEVNMGRYTVRALLQEDKAEKTVTVERYVLPKFKVKTSLDKDYYLPGETIKGTIQADYFFGKPVAQGEVTVRLSTFDVELSEFQKITGTTDGDGSYQFEAKLPTHFVGTPLEQGDAYLQVDVSLKDQADHIEKTTTTSTVAKDPIRIDAIPETGHVVPKVENVIYVMTTYPDGSPAECRVDLGRRGRVLQTDSMGIAKFEVTPEESPFEVRIRAADARGNAGEKTESFEFDTHKQGVLLRTDSSVYKVGQTVRATVLSPGQRGTIFFDLIKDRQTLLTRAVDLEDGRASTRFSLGPNLEGTIWLSAYRIMPSGDIVRDSNALYVDPADDLTINIKPDKETYLPGKEARIDFRVRDEKGDPVAAAIGLNIVDESVFALQDIQPGMEKVYFLLERELMEPKYEIHEFTPRMIVELPKPGPIPLPARAERRDQAAKILFASAELPEDNFFAVNTFIEDLNALKTEWAQAIVKDAETIQNAYNRYRQQRNRMLTYTEGLNALVEAKLISLEQTRDQWGNQYRLQKEPYRPEEDDNVHQIFLTSAGPDGEFDTLDDIPGVPPWPWALEALKDGGAIDFAGAWMAQGENRAMPFMFGARGGGGMMVRRMVGMGPMEEAAAMPMAAVPDAAPGMAGVPKANGGKPEVRIREYFPETMWSEPALITDRNGRARLKVDMADSITTWRLTAMANSVMGQLGSTTEGLKVFQDFFVDIDLPVALTKGDQVSIPVAIYNYLPVEQELRVELTKEDWFTVSGGTEEKLKIASNDVDVVYFTITAKEIGHKKLTVHGYGSQMSDAISREIEVEPNGQLQEIAFNGRLEKDLTQTVTIPKQAIEDASKILVKVYPGIFSQAVEGLDSLLRMPFGCFEQTSSVTYPNILVLDYMKATEQINPEIRMKAEGYINTGYQRLVTFEVPGGGFSWFGDAPANKILTAYGVMEFSDMSEVHPVDQNVITRTQQWLLGQQEADGSWKPDEQYLHQESWGRIQNNKLLPTAYIVWALYDSGAKDAKAQKGLDYLKANWKQADDPYTLALVCNALVAADRDGEATAAALSKLIDMAKEEDEKMWWESKLTTVTHARGNTADVETTALAGYALIMSGRHPAEATKVLNYLIANKDPSGTWGSTMATVNALKCMVASLKSATQVVNAEVSVICNGQNVSGFALDETNSDVLQQVDLKEHVRPGDNEVRIKFAGEGSALYSIVAKYYLPWERVKDPGPGLMSIDVKYDKTQLAKDDLVTASVTVRQNIPGKSGMVVVDLGIPPGFMVEPGDLEELVGSNVIQKFNLTGRQIIVYLDEVDSAKPVSFQYRLRAKFPIRAKTPKSMVYEYYNPENRGFAQPVDMEVRAG